MKTRKQILLLLVVLACIALPSYTFAATSVTTSLSQVVNAGSLSIVTPSSMSFSGAGVGTTNQTVSGTLSPVTTTDYRGTGAGWTSSMTIQHLTLTRTPLAAFSNTSPLITLNSSNRYTGSCNQSTPKAAYTITIISGGAVGTATYSVTDDCGDTNQTNVTTASTGNNVGSRGVKIDFPAGTYVAGNSWHIGVDAYLYTQITVTPQSPTAAVSGSSLTGVTASSSGALSGSGTVSSSKTLLTAGANAGMGSYNQDVLMDITIHAHSYSGSYSGTLVATVS